MRCKGTTKFADVQILSGKSSKSFNSSKCKRLGDLKECDGTHSERSARKVPTLRNQRKHRTKQGDLWDFYGLSVAFYKRVSIIMLQKVAAIVHKVAADLELIVYKVPWLLQRKCLLFPLFVLPCFNKFFELDKLFKKALPKDGKVVTFTNCMGSRKQLL